MKIPKNYVRNRHRPEGCIAESYIVEEAIEFCSDFLSGVDPVGLGIDRLDASLDNSSFGRPLSAGEQDLLYQAHRYVLANTIDVQPYIDKHVEVLQLKYPNKVLHQKWIQEEHNRTFISWLREEVASEIGMGNVEISDNLRWIAHGPHPFVIKYNSYVINGCRYHTEYYDKNRSVQNSGVSLVAKTIQVDLKRIGHKSDSFIMATQARQVFYVEDPSDARWSIVLTPPQRDCEDQSNDDELGDIMLHCQGVPSDMPNVDGGNDLDENMIFSFHMEPTIVRDDQDKEVGGAEIDGLVVGVADEHDKRKLQKERRKKNKYNHRLSRKGYANLREELKNIPSEESELDRASMWKKTRVDKKGQYDNEDVQEVVNRIDEISKTCADKEPSPNDVLTQDLGTRESSGREDAIEVRNEKEVVWIRYQLPFSLFGIGRKACVLREDIIDFCNMREVKTLTLVAYMAGYWALLAINAYDETVYYLDSLRTTSRVDIRYVTDTAITIFGSQKNIQTSCKQPIWKTVKCPLQVGVVECGYYVMRYMRDIITNGSIVVTDLIDTRTSYSQLELDEVRMELADFLGGHM
ncbi:uncharacterized protein E6C27_scaffold269G002580 [Cucumis melo var. makuwa]|uniref:Transposase n=1 Tax=Cucumis melo var. makuwa TaxID=1194695 RepID=A0A5A7SQD4_CUCMM|nr:uncharacterized protein E6C27_scaffold269G002580 [Cucumis melo var. makuwa]